MKAKKRTTEDLVRSIEEPEFTKSWHPVSHGKVIDAMELAIKDSGMVVVDKTYSLHNKGLNMFGTWYLDQGFNGGTWMVGLRNSMSKSFAVGICAGTNIIVCSNMVFSGDFIEFRRHTSGVDVDELKVISNRAIKIIANKLDEFSKWHLSLKEFSINNNDFKLMTYNAMEKNVIPVSKFHDFVECYEEEVKLNEPSLYTFHGGVTRLNKDKSLFTISDYSNRLIKFCDDYIIEKAA